MSDAAEAFPFIAIEAALSVASLYRRYNLWIPLIQLYIYIYNYIYIDITLYIYIYAIELEWNRVLVWELIFFFYMRNWFLDGLSAAWNEQDTSRSSNKNMFSCVPLHQPLDTVHQSKMAGKSTANGAFKLVTCIYLYTIIIYHLVI